LNPNYLKTLRKHLQYQLLEYDLVGKSRPYEILGETQTNSLIRFIIHFLFVSHEFYNLELFDTKEVTEEEKMYSHTDSDFSPSMFYMNNS
jgi:hypothetical protein